ncbi:glutamyl-tRNA reductase [Patulibacter minatonensis]|uniref:glutamyl-tRNA reductase n=1 Tax=Patulibacter minatonensis TaxID=298163 RepID=UPI0005644374|nr:glutamyl-tRNA reductase [Patulibacter minatonensis]
MNELLVLGLSHKTAPVAVRERLSVTDLQIERMLADFARSQHVHEAAVLSTCNRTEIYVVVGDALQAEGELLSIVAKSSRIRPTELANLVYMPRNCDAARHLYRVASGLDSMILGEYEVQGQVKRAYEAALRAGTTGPMLNRLFKAALRTGKRVRTETRLSERHTSVASVAVDLAAQQVGHLEDKNVMIIGAGETAELTAQAFATQGVRTLFVSNRHADRARSLADRFGGRVGTLTELPEQLAEADVVISSTSSPHPVLGAPELAAVMCHRLARPLVLIDIAVPRDIDPHCAAVPSVALYDIDDLQAVVARNLEGREGEASIAEDIVEEEIHKFARWMGQMEITPTIVDLRARAGEIVDHVLAENEGRWESASDADVQRIERAARTIVQRLLHEPTLRLKEARDRDDAHGHVEVLRELFGLDGAEPEVVAGGAPPPECPAHGMFVAEQDAVAPSADVPAAGPASGSWAEVRSLAARRSSAS